MGFEAALLIWRAAAEEQRASAQARANRHQPRGQWHRAQTLDAGVQPVPQLKSKPAAAPAAARSGSAVSLRNLTTKSEHLVGFRNRQDGTHRPAAGAAFSSIHPAPRLVRRKPTSASACWPSTALKPDGAENEALLAFCACGSRLLQHRRGGARTLDSSETFQRDVGRGDESAADYLPTRKPKAAPSFSLARLRSGRRLPVSEWDKYVRRLQRLSDYEYILVHTIRGCSCARVDGSVEQTASPLFRFAAKAQGLGSLASCRQARLSGSRRAPESGVRT